MLKKALAAVALLLIAAAIYLFLPTYKAHRLLSQVEEVQVGKTSFADAQKLAERAGLTASSYCTPTECNWYRRVDNSPLPKFWIGNGANFAAGFAVRNSVVVERGIAEQIGAIDATPVASANLEERTAWSGGAPNPVQVQTQWTAHVPHYGAVVMLASTAPQDVRAKYSNFNLSCMWKYGGCKDAGQLLPGIDWKD